ncbi:c-type cytochrome [Fibrella aquatilis]|uniref:Cytochrome C n=1 Tax=Fibrella aquatilis TaxID=2817059 RepID=A0A939JZA0_9BACT|nr:c-type cytochrome [Fibrella aquatilis]MBO0930716.1 cytochrome C [Fibrella aquatilis]
MKKTLGFLLATASLATASFTAQAQDNIPDDMKALMSKYTCIACHRVDVKLVGPAYKDVAKRNYTNDQIVELIYNPKPSNWPGYIAMAPMKQVPKEDALKLAGWINTLDGTPGLGPAKGAKKGASKKGKKA